MTQHDLPSRQSQTLSTHLIDTESKVTSLAKVSLLQLVLLDLQSSLQNLLSLGSTDSDVTSDLLVTTNGEGSDGVSGLGGDGGLTGELFQYLGSSGEPVSGFTDGDVYRRGEVGGVSSWPRSEEVE